MDLKVPDSVNPSTDTLSHTSNLMNSLPVGECEHRSLFSIQEHEFGRGVLWAKIEPLYYHAVHLGTFAKTVGVWFNTSLALICTC